jgi:hypothetical protein
MGKSISTEIKARSLFDAAFAGRFRVRQILVVGSCRAD